MAEAIRVTGKMVQAFHDELFRHYGESMPAIISMNTERLIAAVAPLIRADALREAAKVAGWAHMVPPDGGSPTEDECRVAQAAEAAIRALIDAPLAEKGSNDQTKGAQTND